MKCETVDFELLLNVIDKMHWTPVFMKTMYYDRDEITNWLEENCVDNVVFHAAGFAFKNTEDAILFSLKWV